MFRQEEVIFGGWREKAFHTMQRRRYDRTIAQLPAMNAGGIEALDPAALARKIERSWQDVARKPLRRLQMNELWNYLRVTMNDQADCLSHEEHELVERALAMGECIRLDDISEIEAAQALSLRLWGSLGLISGTPYFDLEPRLMQPAAEAIERAEHSDVRRRLCRADRCLARQLYISGTLDDCQPQQILLRSVFGNRASERQKQLIRRYLWATYDCVDYSAGVMLVHSALADPSPLVCRKGRSACTAQRCRGIDADAYGDLDILPEEIPPQRALECQIDHMLRPNLDRHEVAQEIRFLCKQGAPLCAMEEILQSSLIVCLSDGIRNALKTMFFSIPKWIECTEYDIRQ